MARQQVKAKRVRGPDKKPRAGTKLDWVAQRLQLTNAELVELAKKERRRITLKQIHRMRSVLSTQFGMPSVGGKRGGWRGKKKRRPTAPAAEPTTPTDRELKRKLARRLFFELGFDDMHELFDEYLAMHSRLKGDDSP